MQFYKYLLTNWLLLGSSLCVVIFFSSCYGPKEIYYVNDLRDSTFKNISTTPPVIQRGDQLFIFVSSPNVESTSIFNMPNFGSPAVTNANLQSQNNPILGYLVDENGNIILSKIGTVRAAGFTFNQLKDTLENKLSSFIKDPIVSIRLINFRVTVLGEVARPGTYNVPFADLNILQALGMAGDLLITGKRNDVLLYRQTDSSKNSYRIKLTDKNLINHPAFNIKSGDVIYVQPNKVKMNTSSTFFQIWPTVASAATLLILVLNNLK
jgi:polysaccharide export outer membrane protein